MTTRPLLIAVVLLACQKDRHGEALSAAQQTQLRDALTKARAEVVAADAGWSDAIAKVDPLAHADAERCTALDFEESTLSQNPQSWHGWDLSSIPWERGGVMSVTTTPFPVTIIGKADAIPANSPEASARLHEIDRMLAEIASPSFRTFDDRMKDIPKTLYATDVLVRLDVAIRPKEVVANTRVREFEGGFAHARAWMYDHAKKSVVCAGIISAESSASVDTGWTSIGEDLLLNLIRAIPRSLRKT